MKLTDWDYRQHLAFLLLTDAVCSELDGDWDELRQYYPGLSLADFKRLREAVIRPGGELTSSLLDVCSDRGVDPTDFLPIDIVKDYVAAVDKAWDGKATVEEIYDELPSGAFHLILGAVGHGSQLGDDREELDWLEEKGIGEKDHKDAGSISDSYHSYAGELVEKLLGRTGDDDYDGEDEGDD